MGHYSDLHAEEQREHESRLRFETNERFNKAMELASTLSPKEKEFLTAVVYNINNWMGLNNLLKGTK